MKSSKRRGGLQHGLSEIINPPMSLDEKSRYTAELLSKVSPKANPSPATVDQLPENQATVKTDPILRSPEINPIGQISSKSTGDQQPPVTESPVDQQSLVTDSHQYINKNPSASQSPVTSSHGYTEPDRSFVKVPNGVFDRLLALLDPYEFKVYMRLFRLSHGFRKSQCLVGYTALADACALSTRHIKRVIPELEMKGLVKVVSIYNSGEIKGTVYEVYAGDQQSLVTNSHPRPTVTSDRESPNKYDHDDHIKTDHHHSAHAQETMTIYQSITGNSWSKADQVAYEKIKLISTATIEQGIRVAMSRAASRPGSLAYFVKEILAIANPAPASIAQRRRELTAIVQRVRAAHTGQASYSIADFSADVKEACARDGVIFDHQLFNEMIG